MKTLLVIAGLIASGMLLVTSPVGADELPGTGTLSGVVSAGEPFQAAQVYAHNPAMAMTYMVYTSGGHYRAVNLMPGTYQLNVLHAGFESDPLQVVIEAGKPVKADFTLRKTANTKPPVVGSARGAPADAKLVAYDELYPAGPGLATIERTCMSCHGRNFIPLKSGLDEAGWKALVELMLGMDDTAWGDRGALTGVEEAVPMLPESITISAEERADLERYLVQHFGPGTSPRMVLNDEVVPVDEAALANAMWIEYTAPDRTPESGPEIRFQEQYFDLDGNVWLTEGLGASGALEKLDPRTATWTRFPYQADRFGHGVVTDPMEKTTILWIAGRGYDVARLDPQTGQYTWFGDTSSTRRWGGHTPVFDSKGVLWYTGIQEDELGRWDRQTNNLKTWKIPTAGGRPYGIIVDRDDNIWFGNLHTCTVTRFNQKTEAFTEFVSPSAPCALRRPGLDSTGAVWYGSFSDGTLGRIDPDTGKMTEWKVGRFAEPYEAYADPDDNIWVSDGGQNMLARFDQETEQFTYFPAPAPHSDRPKMHITRDGAIWYNNRGAAASGTAPAKAGVLHPDMNRMKSFGAYFAVKNGRAVGAGSPAPGQ